MESKHRIAYKRFIIIYHSVAVVLFLGMGVFLLVSPDSAMQVNKQYKTTLGILLVVYALYRTYKAYRKLTFKDNEEQEDNED